MGQAKRFFLPKVPLISGSFSHPKCKFPGTNYTKPIRVNISESSLPVPCPFPTFPSPYPPTPLPKANGGKEYKSASFLNVGIRMFSRRQRFGFAWWVAWSRHLEESRRRGLQGTGWATLTPGLSCHLQRSPKDPSRLGVLWNEWSQRLCLEPDCICPDTKHIPGHPLPASLMGPSLPPPHDTHTGEPLCSPAHFICGPLFA